jgi:hypothetical protein
MNTLGLKLECVFFAKLKVHVQMRLHTDHLTVAFCSSGSDQGKPVAHNTLGVLDMSSHQDHRSRRRYEDGVLVWNSKKVMI